MRRLTVVLMALALAVGMSVPASATIHEVVASFCSNYEFPEQSGHPTGDQHDPPGLTLHEHNLAQPLIASGMFASFDIYLPDEWLPEGDENPEFVTTTTSLEILIDEDLFTVHFVEGDRIDGPHNKFPWDGKTYLQLEVDVPVVVDGDLLADTQEWIFPKLEADHPAFERCPHFERGPWYLEEDHALILDREVHGPA